MAQQWPEWPRENDPELWDLYAEGLLEPGWAGVLTLAQAEYIAAELAKSASLRRAWRFRKRKRYPLTLIAERAFPEKPRLARQHMLTQMQTARAKASEMPTVASIPSTAKLKENGRRPTRPDIPQTGREPARTS